MLFKIVTFVLIFTVIQISGNCNIPNNREWINGELVFTTDDNATNYEQRWRTENITGVGFDSPFEYASVRLDTTKQLLIFGVLPSLKKRYIVYEFQLTKSVNMTFECANGSTIKKIFTLNVHQVTKNPPGYQLNLYYFNLPMPMYPGETAIFPTPIAHDLSINEYLRFYFTSGECDKYFKFVVSEVKKKEFFTKLTASKYVYLKDVVMLCGLAAEDMDGTIAYTQVNITARDKRPWEYRSLQAVKLS